MKVIGLDIGTTTISAVVLDGKTGEIIEKNVVDNSSFIATEHSWEKIQDASFILLKAKELIDQLIIKYASIGCIGLTGQMHGILYVDKLGNALSPLYTWEDGRGDLMFDKHLSYTEFICQKTGYKVAAGYGVVTHFYNFHNKMIPKNACYLCTIYDYVAMKLSAASKPMINNTSAASLGLFNIEQNGFDYDAIKRIGLDIDIFPKVVHKGKPIGKTGNNIPVIVGIGDNQASFIGSVRSVKDSILINIGTGSQISVYTKKCKICSQMETRPCAENDYLLVGSSLCGGRAYALLEEFFQSLITVVIGKKHKDIYSIMNKMAGEAINLDDKLKITTTFSGTRKRPSKRGKIENLSTHNFTPQQFTLGVLEGIVNELYDMYQEVKNELEHEPAMLIGSGNGIRKNPILQEILSKKFNMAIKIPIHNEEASYGAAIFALVGIGYFEDLKEAQQLIKYYDE